MQECACMHADRALCKTSARVAHMHAAGTVSDLDINVLAAFAAWPSSKPQSASGWGPHALHIALSNKLEAQVSAYQRLQLSMPGQFARVQAHAVLHEA
eukprot:308466-Chlamydomonas_euryale.AAC.2